MKKWILLPFGLISLIAFMVVSCNKLEFSSEVPSTGIDKIVSSISAPIEGSYMIKVAPSALSGDADLRSLGFEEKQNAMKQTALQLMSDLRIPLEKLGYVYGVVLKGFSLNGLTDDELFRIQNDSRILYVEQDQSIQLMGGPPGNGGGPPNGGNGQEIPWGIERVGGSCNGAGKQAWILDTGIDLDHPDLNVNATLGYNSFSTGKDSKSLDDGNGHGSHVSGTIAALDNAIGVVGVAPGAAVIPVKVLNSQGSGSYSGVISGVNWVGGHGGNGDVANMSLGGPVSQSLDEAVVDAAANGIKFALAAGNESDDANNHSPARANHANIYTVSAMNSSDNWASFSNYGNPPIEFCAPGVSIISTWKGGGYNTISGTSMASPHVAGLLLCGAVQSDGTVNGDPDNNPDPIAHR